MSGDKPMWLLIAVLLMIGCAGENHTLRRDVEMAERPRDLVGFSRILANDIRPGDSIEKVEAHLGRGQRLTPGEHAAAVAAVRRWRLEQPSYYADGTDEGDLFLRWPLPDECTTQLQFRDGRLINHVPESYLSTAGEKAHERQ